MVKNRKYRERGRIFFDSIDFSILELISQKEGISVMPLVKKIKIKHNNFKMHFEKLKSFKFIYIEKEKQVKKIFLTNRGKEVLCIFNQSPTSQTSPNGDFSNEKEHNISLKTTPTAPSKLPTATSLNNNIHRLHLNLKKCSQELSNY